MSQKKIHSNLEYYRQSHAAFKRLELLSATFDWSWSNSKPKMVKIYLNIKLSTSFIFVAINLMSQQKPAVPQLNLWNRLYTATSRQPRIFLWICSLFFPEIVFGDTKQFSEKFSLLKIEDEGNIFISNPTDINLYTMILFLKNIFLRIPVIKRMARTVKWFFNYFKNISVNCSPRELTYIYTNRSYNSQKNTKRLQWWHSFQIRKMIFNFTVLDQTDELSIWKLLAPTFFHIRMSSQVLIFSWTLTLLTFFGWVDWYKVYRVTKYFYVKIKWLLLRLNIYTYSMLR